MAIINQPDSAATSTGGLRAKKYRQRKRDGIICVAPVQIRATDIDFLRHHGYFRHLPNGYMRNGLELDRVTVARAIEQFMEYSFSWWLEQARELAKPATE